MNGSTPPQTEKEREALKQKTPENTPAPKHTDFPEEELHPNYVLIDAALWGSDIDIILQDENAVYRSLFRGSTGEKLWSVAPYLVDVSSDEALVKKIKEKKSVERRVTWLSSPLGADELCRHLRRFLRMQGEDKGYMYFRFYDPFVVNAVFPHLSGEQAAEFFEPLNYVIADDIRVNERQLYYLSPQKVLQIKQQTLDHVDNNR